MNLYQHHQDPASLGWQEPMYPAHVLSGLLLVTSIGALVVHDKRMTHPLLIRARLRGAIVEGRAGVVKRQHDIPPTPKYTHQLGKYSFQSAGEWTFGKGGKEGAEEKGEQGVEMQSAPEEGTDVEGGKARRRACLESRQRHKPSSSSISGGYKRLHGKKETSAEREEGSKTGRRTKERGSAGEEGVKMVGAHAIPQSGGSCNLHTKSVDPKCKALREVPSSARCIVPDRLGDYRAKRGCMERGQSWVRAVGQRSLSLEVAPFSEIKGYLDEQGGKRKTGAGWEGLFARGGLRDDAQSAYSARRASGEQIRAHRVRQYACKRMFPTPRAASARSTGPPAGRRCRCLPLVLALLGSLLALGIGLVVVVAGGIGGLEESVTLVWVGEEHVFCGGFGHRGAWAWRGEDVWLCVKRVAMARNTDKYGSVARTHDRRHDLHPSPRTTLTFLKSRHFKPRAQPTCIGTEAEHRVNDPVITNGTWNHLLEALPSSPPHLAYPTARHPATSTGSDDDPLHSLRLPLHTCRQHSLRVRERHRPFRCGSPPIPTCPKLRCVSGSGIRHVALAYTPHMWIMSDTYSTVFLPSPQGGEGGGIELQSLSLQSTEMLDYNLLLHSCLVDLSRLKALSIGWRTRIPWPVFAPHVTRIEELDVVLNSTILTLAPLLSLSFPSAPASPKLTTLRLSLPVWIPARNRLAFAGELFAGLTPSANITANLNAHGNTNLYPARGNENTSKLRTLVLSADARGYDPPDGGLCTLLDGAAVELGVELKLEVDTEIYAGPLDGSGESQGLMVVDNMSVFLDSLQTLINLTGEQ
ncbi:hypothetical protein B0H14DRAFT_3684176 [Mycena olivaceomarginata]|nr:hypothetical protein B0H14DRAFT_3684176 [Mycena olivaceomarginata]